MAQVQAVTAEKLEEGSIDGTNAGAGASTEILEAEEKLFMVDQGFNADDIMNSRLYKLNMSLLEDEAFKDDSSPNAAVPPDCQLMFKKLVLRLSAFYVNSEKHRLVGPTEAQIENLRKSGFSFGYRVELHKCLRNLLLQVINQKEISIKIRLLREVYGWFFYKLKAIGALSA